MVLEKKKKQEQKQINIFNKHNMRNQKKLIGFFSVSISIHSKLQSLSKPLHLEMPIFDTTVLNGLVEEWKVVEKKDHKKTGEFFKRYEQSFIDEVMEHVNGIPEGRSEPRISSMMKNLKFKLKSHEEEIELYLYSYNTTNFGDNTTKTMNGKVKFKGDETYRDAGIRLGYHKLCKPIPYVKESGEDKSEQVKEDKAANADAEAHGEDPERPAPFHFVYDFTDARYKIAELFGPNFTIFKKFRQTDNSMESFGKPFIKTYQVTLFLKFYPLGIDDEDWLAKKPGDKKKSDDVDAISTLGTLSVSS